MSRSSRVLVPALTLFIGFFLGLAVGRRGEPVLSAQPPVANGPAAAVAQPSAGPSPRATSDEAVYHELDRQYAQFESINRTFELVARAVSPAVVHIVAAKSGRTDDSARVRHYEETGSGVIIRGENAPALYVLTNNHVVEGAAPAKISIYLQDGRALHPDQVWLDAKADIAVMHLTRDDLPAARLGNSDAAAVGTWVLALGSPFGLTHSVSQGIISARGRHVDELQDVENQDFLQTDAAINPGNSGGPLVNMKGEVIGINNSIASNGGGNEGVGFSIPINLARWIMGQLVSKGRVSRGALGVDLHPEFRPEDAIALGLDRPHGAWVDVVHPSSPAAQSGLKNGDVVLSFQGVDVHDLNHLINMVSMAPIGRSADLVVWRDRKSLALRVTVGDRDRTIAQAPLANERVTPRGGLLRRPDQPPPPPSPSTQPPAASTATASTMGVEMRTLDDASARQLGMASTARGALVLKVSPTSPLAGIVQPSDVIHTVNGSAAATAEDAVRLFGRHASEGLIVGFDRVARGMVERRTARVP
jgi:serine protease Do